MRQAARTKGLRAPVSAPVSLPSPIGGWNARDGLSEMAATDAVSLTNWFPGTTECVLRGGYTQHSTGYPSQVETLMSYAGGAIDKLFAISNGGIYDATTAGAVGAAAVSGLINSRFQYINFTTAGGSFLLAVNGADKMRYYDGTTWSADGGTFTVTGVDTARCSGIMVHKNRVWLVQDDTLKVWYLPTSAIAGAANAIDMSAVAQLGGYIVSAATWTIDAGTGVDDLFVAVTSKGEVIVYQGTDPSSASTWALKGVWRLGSPVGKRCLFKFGGDLLMISQDGVVPLSAALQSSRVNPKVALTDKIQFAVSLAVSSYGGNFGWQLAYFAKENQLWLNVPLSNGMQQQYVMNTISKAWCNYTGWNANCWEFYQDNPYFGGDGYVGKAWDGNADNGSAIPAMGLQAFNSFGAPGMLKRFTMSRPVFRASGSPSVLASINTDFNTDDSTAPLSFSALTYGVWDLGVWDTAIWGGDLQVIQPWQGASGVGYYGAPQVKTSSSGLDVRWVSTDIVFERGAVL